MDEKIYRLLQEQNVKIDKLERTVNQMNKVIMLMAGKKRMNLNEEFDMTLGEGQQRGY